MPSLPDKRVDRQAWRLAPLALVLACCLYASGFWLFAPMGDLPWQQVTGWVQEAWQPGDAVTTRPWWAARAREYLGQKAFIQVRDLERADLSHYSRLWVLDLPGYGRDLAGPFADGRYRAIERKELEGMRLTLYELPPPVHVLYDFREQLKKARVTMRGKPKDTPCATWQENRWICSRQGWNYVGRMIVEIGADPQEVIWAHPAGRLPIDIVYEQVPGGRELMLHTGLTPAAARVAGGATVLFEVLIDDRPVASRQQPNESTWTAMPVDISGLGPGPHRVTFRVSAVNSGMRHFCFRAEVRR